MHRPRVRLSAACRIACGFATACVGLCGASARADGWTVSNPFYIFQSVTYSPSTWNPNLIDMGYSSSPPTAFNLNHDPGQTASVEAEWESWASYDGQYTPFAAIDITVNAQGTIDGTPGPNIYFSSQAAVAGNGGGASASGNSLSNGNNYSVWGNPNPYKHNCGNVSYVSATGSCTAYTVDTGAYSYSTYSVAFQLGDSGGV